MTCLDTLPVGTMIIGMDFKVDYASDRPTLHLKLFYILNMLVKL